MASSTARILVSRGRPTRNFAGMCGSISAHSSSVVSLAYRSPSRRYLMRVISVHDILGSPSLLTPRQNHKWLESLNSIFGQPLSLFHHTGAERGARRGGVVDGRPRLPISGWIAAGG